MGNGFILIKFANEMDCLSSALVCLRTILNLQRWRKDFDPFKESNKSVIVWICLPCLPLELWGESILRKLLKQIGNVIKIDTDSEDVSKGRCQSVYRSGYF